MKTKIAVYVGRFCPFHLGHNDVLTHLTENYDRVKVILGSIDAPRNVNTPWTFEERKEYVSLHVNDLSKVSFSGIRDTIYQKNSWIKRVYREVYDYCSEISSYEECEITIVGHVDRDSSEEYQHWFKNWNFLDASIIESSHGHDNLNATSIRLEMFKDEFEYTHDKLENSDWVHKVTPQMTAWLLKFFAKEHKSYIRLLNDYDHLIEVQKKCVETPYGIEYKTADAVVTQSGHVLMIKRRSDYGDQLWALPGGHVEKSENSDDAAIRELIEETEIKIQEHVLRKSIKSSNLFEEPERSPRGRLGEKLGRTTTMAYHISLSDDMPLPKVKTTDESYKVWWIDYAELENMRDKIFEDHYDIIRYFLDRGE